MKYILIAALSTLNFYAKAEDAVVISLGYRCQTAMQLRFHNIRQAAYPFDWLITPFESLYLLLDNEFEGFLDEEHLQFRSNYYYEDDEGQFKMEKYPHIWESHYNIIFRHDFRFKDNFMNAYKEIHEKYRRRIDRFYKTLASGKHIYFIRHIITREEAQLLSDLLISKYPDLQFTLLALDYREDAKDPWNIKNVLNYYLPIPIPYLRDGSNTAWGEILLSAHLIEAIESLTKEEMREIYHQSTLYA